MSRDMKRVLKSQLINITLEPTIADVASFKIRISSNATINEMRKRCTRFNKRFTSLVFIFNGTELSDDEATLSDYGITKDCTIRIVARMHSGRRNSSLESEARNTLKNMSEMVLFIPMQLPTPSKSLTNLRTTVRKLNNNTIPSAAVNQHQLVAEHAATRKRMYELMKRKKNNSISSLSQNLPSLATTSLSSPTSSRSSLSSVSTCNSLCGSIEGHPLPDKEEIVVPKLTTSEQNTETINRKDLFLYFDPPETRRELQFMRQNLYDPPQNLEELEIVRAELNAQCGVCKKRLPITARSIVCKCSKTFCRRHRYDHNCSIDYKQEERRKIELMNPKLEDHGAPKE